MIIFVGVSLVMVAVIYGVQDAFLWESGFTEIRKQSRPAPFMHVYSCGISKDTEVPPAPVKPAGPISVGVPSSAPTGPQTEDRLEDADAFLCAEFRHQVELFANRGPADSFGCNCRSARLPGR
jgi:hypothetical protein